MTNLISTPDLEHKLGEPNLVVLDASWHLPTAKRDAKAEFITVRIPGARFFDLDATSDQSSSLPHMMPSSADFEESVGALGIDNRTQVVCYDSVGLFSAARCWWMFKTLGHGNVYVLDGGLKKWLAEDRRIESGSVSATDSKSFHAQQRSGSVAAIDDVAAAIVNGLAQIADARSAARFKGEEAEPRSGVQPGHMPGAYNVHYASLLKADGGMKSHAELSKIFHAAGLDLDKPIITSCGSGVTAAVLTLALAELGVTNHRLYDGSWAEWGASGRSIEKTGH